MKQQTRPARAAARLLALPPGEIPRLFSEGPEPEPHRPALLRWQDALKQRLLSLLHAEGRR